MGPAKHHQAGSARQEEILRPGHENQNLNMHLRLVLTVWAANPSSPLRNSGYKLKDSDTFHSISIHSLTVILPPPKE